MHGGPKYLTVGPILPLTTEDDLKNWKGFFRGKGWTEKEIGEAGCSKGASAYVKVKCA